HARRRTAARQAEVHQEVGLAEIGLPLAWENHRDYYVSDVVELCRRVPNMGLFLDTGNTYLIGERPHRGA
ncbi:MAG: hypothetical protein ACOCW3_06650, partial [Spirochaetota bacterium]